jgi:hypothetical protein
MPGVDLVPQKMSEAQVSLLLAIHLVSTEKVASDVQVALDGAQVKIGNDQHFDVVSFMDSHRWKQHQDAPRWQGKYVNGQSKHSIVVHSQSGQGDVTAILLTGETLLVESKKGTLVNSKSSSEYPLIREALGQLLTIETVPENVILAVAVPHGERFIKLAERWRKAPLLVRLGLRILTVSSTGAVSGW